MPLARLAVLVRSPLSSRLASPCSSPPATRSAAGGCTITVDSTGDDVTADNVVTLREAMQFATDASEPAAGETDEVGCADPGADTNDYIVFDDTVFPLGGNTTIAIGSGLPELSTGGDIIAGPGDNGETVTVDGMDGGYYCFWMSSSYNQVRSLRITGCTTGVIMASELESGDVHAAITTGPTKNLVALNTIVGNIGRGWDRDRLAEHGLRQLHRC